MLLFDEMEDNGAGEAIRTPDPNLGKTPVRDFHVYARNRRPPL